MPCTCVRTPRWHPQKIPHANDMHLPGRETQVCQCPTWRRIIQGRTWDLIMENVCATWVASTVPQNHPFPLRNTHIQHCDVRATPVMSTTSRGSTMVHLPSHHGKCACHSGAKHSSSEPPVSLEKYAHPTLRCKSDTCRVHNKLGECNVALDIS